MLLLESHVRLSKCLLCNHRDLGSTSKINVKDRHRGTYLQCQYWEVGMDGSLEITGNLLLSLVNLKKPQQ